MLLLERLLTSFVLFVVLFPILFIGALAIGGGLMGARAGATNPQAKDFRSGYEVGQQAGAEFGKRYGPIVFFGALGISAVCSIALPFAGLFPWCRRETHPPPIP